MHSTTASSSDSNSPSQGAIAGAVIGSIAGIILIAGLGYCLGSRRRKHEVPETSADRTSAAYIASNWPLDQSCGDEVGKHQSNPNAGIPYTPELEGDRVFELPEYKEASEMAHHDRSPVSPLQSTV